MSRIATLALLIVAMCTPLSAGAVGKSTVDPNVGHAKAFVAASSADVKQKVTYDAKRKTVASIIADLSKMTGVNLKAGYSDADWQVRDRRMNVFVKDLPLSDLMDSMARVMKFQWSKRVSDSGAVSYRLYMDRKVLLGAERQRCLEEERLEQKQTEGRKRLIDGLDSAADMSEFELAALKARSPYTYMLAKRGWASLLAKVLDEDPLAKAAFLSGQYYHLEMSSLSPATIQGIAAFQQAQATTGYGYGKLGGNIGTGSITINGSQEGKGFDLAAISIADVRVTVPGISSQMGMEDPDSDSAKLWATMVDARLQGDKEEATRVSEQLAKASASTTGDMSEPMSSHDDDATLQRQVKLNAADDYGDTLRDLSESSGFAVVSDSFSSRLPGLSFADAKIRLQAALDKVATASRSNWERHSSTLEFHDRDWFRKRAAQIPEAWLEDWRKSLRDRGTLDIDQLAHIASLSPEQIWVNVLTDDMLGQVMLSWSVDSNRELLALWTGLNRQRRLSVLTGQGLSLDDLVGDSSPAIQSLMKRCSGLSTPSRGLRLTGTRRKQDSCISYAFRVVTPSGADTGLRWNLTSPVYEPPKEDKPQRVEKKDAAQTAR